MGYVKCPRCDLNWILEEQKLCDVCRAELKMDGASLLSDELDDDELVLCPICKQNYMGATEEMCEQCLAERADKSVESNTEESEDSWIKEYIDDTDTDDTLTGDWDDNGVSLEQMEDDEFDDEDESYDDTNNPDDDLDFETYDDDEEFDDLDEEELDDLDEEDDL